MKTDIFRRKMCYLYKGAMGASLVALDLDRGKVIVAMNDKGKRSEDLEEVAEVENGGSLIGRPFPGQDRVELSEREKKKKGGKRKGKREERKAKRGKAEQI